MTYTLPTIAKALSAFATGAIGAAFVAAGGPDLSSLGLGEILGSLAAGLGGAGAVFVTPNKRTEPEKTPVDIVREAVEARNSAQSDLDQIADLAIDLGTAVLGPLTTKILEKK